MIGNLGFFDNYVILGESISFVRVNVCEYGG